MHSNPSLDERSLTAALSHPVRAASLGACLILGASALGWFVTTEGARRTGELGLDRVISANREAPLVDLSTAINIVLGPLFGPLAVVVLALAIGMRHRMAGGVFAVVAIVGWLSVGFGKLVFQRPRPPMAQVHALVLETGLDSFPSGHTAIAASILAGGLVALRITDHSTRWAWSVGVPVVLLVAASRLYLGVHYLGDVVGAILYVSGTVFLLIAFTTVVLQRWGSGGVNPLERMSVRPSDQIRHTQGEPT